MEISLPRSLRRLGVGALALGAVALGGKACSAGCSYLSDPRDVISLEDRDFSRIPFQAQYFVPESMGTTSDGYLWDADGDTLVDAIGLGGMAKWHVRGYDGNLDWDPIEMSPEIRAAATEVKIANMKLSRLLTEDVYRQAASDTLETEE